MQPYLKILDVFIGNKCNLACDQCDTRSDIIRTKDYDPSLDEIKQGITFAQKHFRIESYTMLGGEPLLYLDKITDIVEFIRETDSTGHIIIPTNATLLNKHQDQLAEIMTKYRASLYVSNHYAGFEKQKRAQDIKQAVEQFASKLDFKPITFKEFNSELFDLNNTHNDPHWAQWLEPRLEGILADGLEEQEIYTNGATYIWHRRQDTFQQHFYNDADNRPKPFRTGNPDKSYRYGCCSPYCTFMRGTKLYKCGALGTLNRFLDYHEALSDPDWDRYVNYKPLDLSTCTTEEAQIFSDKKFYADNACDMCPTESKWFVKTEEQVLPIKFIKRPT
jgi:organic radical activating enzyme